MIIRKKPLGNIKLDARFNYIKEYYLKTKCFKSGKQIVLPIAGELPKQFKSTTSPDSQFYI